MKSGSLIACKLAIAACFVSIANANADVLITPADITSAEYSGALCSPTSTCSSDTLSGPGTITLGSSSLTFSANPSPSITASVTGLVTTGSGNPVPDTSGTFQGFSWDTSAAYAGIQYYAAISGPNNGPVPVDLAYTIAMTVSGYAEGQVWVALNPSSPIPSGQSFPCPSTYVPLKQLTTFGGSLCSNETIGHVSSATFTGTLTEMITPDTQFDVGELVRLSIPNGAGATGYASVDPVLYIDPSFASVDPNYLTDYSIVLSPGVGNTEDVPEPSSIALLLAGLSLLVAGRLRCARIGSKFCRETSGG